MKRAIDIFQTIEVVIAIAVLLLLLVPKFIGYETYVIKTGSMEPNLPTNSVAYLKCTNAEDINIKDIIAFYIDNETVVTHRVIDINYSEEYFVTKGDANEAVDPLHVKFENCIGIVKFHIPYMGRIIKVVQKFYGKIVLGGVVVFNIILSVMIRIAEKHNDTE